jgi:hypothetical protein
MTQLVKKGSKEPFFTSSTIEPYDCWAIENALKRWPALQRYASSGRLPIDNNPVENAIRPIAIGKKN